MKLVGMKRGISKKGYCYATVYFTGNFTKMEVEKGGALGMSVKAENIYDNEEESVAEKIDVGLIGKEVEVLYTVDAYDRPRIKSILPIVNTDKK